MKVLSSFLFLILLSSELSPQIIYHEKSRLPESLTAGYISSERANLRAGSSDPVKVVLPNSGANLTLPCAPQGSRRFIRACYLITPDEMAYSQFGVGMVSSVGWTWIALESQNITTSGSLKVFLQNTSDSVYSKGTSFASAIGGMTKLIDGSITIPAGEGTFSIDVTAGGPGTSPFSTAAGAGVYVAFEYETVGILAVPLGSPTVSCNDSLTSGAAFNSGQLIPNDTLNLTGVRPETRFGDTSPDVVELLSIYTLGSIPFPYGFPDTLGIRIANNTAHSSNDFRVSSINTVNSSFVFDTTFSASTSFSFIPLELPTIWNPQNDLVIVKALPGDVTDFQLQYCHNITPDMYNHADPCIPEDGGLGFTGINGRFVAAFHNYSSQIFPIDAIDHCFINDSSAGLQQYNIVIYQANLSGKPGALLYLSPPLLSPLGNTSSQHVTHMLPNSVFIPPGAKFFVGYRQILNTNINACFQYENPVREKSFYYTLTDTGTVWTAFEDDSLNYRLDISARTCKNLKMRVFLQGFYDGSSMVKDRVIVELRNYSYPYAQAGIDTSFVDSTGYGYFNFPFSNPLADYYFVVRHRNHLQTWSHGMPEKIDSCTAYYDFTDSSSKAFGNNMAFVSKADAFAGGAFAIFAGDVNQDGAIDGGDASLIDNDSFTFLTGYVPTDVNGDGIVDATDALYCDNNAHNFVTVISP